MNEEGYMSEERVSSVKIIEKKKQDEVRKNPS